MNDLERFSQRYRAEPNGCWVWTGGKDPDGYGIFRYKGKSVRAHRLSWMFHNGEWPGEAHVLHRCDNPSCVNPAHLFLGTCADNMKDKVKKGRQAKRATHGRTILTEEQVASVKRSSESNAVLAKQFGVCEGTVWHIRHNLTWR